MPKDKTTKYLAVFLQDKPFLGNQIVLIPFFHFLRRKYPDHRIIVCASVQACVVPQAFGYIDIFHPYPSAKDALAYLRVVAELKKKNIQVAYLHRRHSIKTGLLGWLGSGNKLVGFSAKTTGLFLNKAVQFDLEGYSAQNFLSLIGKKLSDFSKEFKRKAGDYFVIIPGGTFIQKKYPIEKYMTVASHLRRIAPVHFLLGKDMAAEISVLSDLSDTFVVHIDEPLEKLQDIIRKAAVVISNDCGPSHFAHIYDIPRVGLFSWASKINGWFYPTAKSVLLLPPKDKSIAHIEMERVIGEAIRLRLNNTF